MTARNIDRMSTVLIDAGVHVVKRNPIKVGGYLFGILLCLFFNVCTRALQLALLRPHLFSYSPVSSSPPPILFPRFQGWQTSELQMTQYTQTLEGLSDYKLVEQTKMEVDAAYRDYYRVKGWFSCNAQCQVRY